MASITFNKPGKMASEIEINAFNDPPLYDPDEEDSRQEDQEDAEDGCENMATAEPFDNGQAGEVAPENPLPGKSHTMFMSHVEDVSRDDAPKFNPSNTGISRWFIFLDLETVNSDHYNDGIVEIGGKIVNGAHIALPSSAPSTFHSFVKPPTGTKWDSYACAVHKIQPAQVASAPLLPTVMQRFFEWIRACYEVITARTIDERPIKLCFAGHNIAACDLTWIHSVCVRYAIQLPPYIDAYWDTLIAINSKKTYPLHSQQWSKDHPAPETSGEDNTNSLGSLWRKLRGQQGHEATGTHTVLFDIDMNIDVANAPGFWKYRTQVGSGMKDISVLWATKRKNVDKRNADINPPLPTTWKDIPPGPTDDPADTYIGPTCGPRSGCAGAQPDPTSLANVFLEFLPEEALCNIAACSTHYATVQPVRRVVSLVIPLRPPSSQRDGTCSLSSGCSM